MNAVGRTILVLSLLAVACGAPSNSPDIDGTWVGTITTEGNVTTVVNEAGSVWGGTATLVEEISIGVESGPDEYMFGRINDIYADDQAIYVIDGDVPAVRMYEPEGNYVRDFGQRGQGPGEYARPIQVAAASDGRVFVVDNRTRRINVFDADGAPTDAYPLEGRVVCCNQPFVIDGQGVPWLAYQSPDPSEPGSLRYTIRAHGPEGVIETRQLPPLDFEPQSVSFNGRDFAVPFAAFPIWNLSRSGAVIVGTSDRYRFEIHATEDNATVVEKFWEPTPLAEAEAEYYRGTWVEQGMAAPGWDGGEIPQHKPAFSSFWGSASGDVWVLRSGPGIRNPACDEPNSNALCWKNSVSIDAFEAGGKFLGQVELPEEIREPFMSGIGPRPFRRGNRVFAVAIDDAGVLRVKRYRLVLPGEEER